MSGRKEGGVRGDRYSGSVRGEGRGCEGMMKTLVKEN